MRRLVTGVDSRGRSCVVEASDVVPAPAGGTHGVSVARLFVTDQNPPPPAEPARGEWIDARLDPGLVRVAVIDHPPYDPRQETTATVLHHSDAIDLVVVESGTARLVLDDGAHDIGPGDFVVMPGVDHAIRGGPDGCRLVAFKIGTPPRGT